ncbi:hypothetical protein D3C86_2198610 [compost metagenome]
MPKVDEQTWATIEEEVRAGAEESVMGAMGAQLGQLAPGQGEADGEGDDDEEE